MTTKIINGFTIVRIGLTVSISPGTMIFNGTRNRSCEWHEVEQHTAAYRFVECCKYAEAHPIMGKEIFWRKLNTVSTSVYLRFQRMFARHNNGKWIRGLNICNGEVNFNLE